ncbi:hypothetical protein ACX3V1_11060, partial [Escherichia coli]
TRFRQNEILRCLVGSEMCIRDSQTVTHSGSVLSIALIKHITGKIPRDTYAESYPYLSITGIIP